MGDEVLHPTRRRLIKGAAAASVAAAVWSEPTIRGLARRPAYAQSSSTGTTVVFAPGTYSLPYTDPVSGITISSGGPTNAKYLELSLAGHVCTFDDDNVEIFVTKNNSTSSVFTIAGSSVTTSNPDLSGNLSGAEIIADVSVTCVPI